MSSITPERLRPMTDTERAAVELFEELTAGGKSTEEATKEIADLTGMPVARIAAAVELKGKFGSLLGDVADPPKADVPVVKTVVKPKPAPPAARASDTDKLITDAEDSPQPRARELAAEIRRALAAIRQILDNDERVRVLTASIDVMRRQLAADEAELRKLLGDSPTTIEPAAAAPAEAESEPEPAEAATPASGRDPLAYSEDVRKWAKDTGWEVGSAGRISGVIVAAYRAAHPAINGHRIES